MMKVLGIIPARGGSKGVLRKNLKPILGVPLIYYTIRAAQGSKFLSKVVVTTDDEEIRETVLALGIEVVHRPRELASDEAPMPPVVEHVLKTVEEKFDGILLLQPTCPLRESRDIDKAIELLATREAKAVIGVHKVEDYHPARMYRLDEGVLKPMQEEFELANRQDLPVVYHRNGAIYAVKTDVFLKERSLFPSGSIPYLMSEEHSINIDTEWDFLCAELALKRHGYENPRP